MLTNYTHRHVSLSLTHTHTYTPLHSLTQRKREVERERTYPKPLNKGSNNHLSLCTIKHCADYLTKTTKKLHQESSEFELE